MGGNLYLGIDLGIASCGWALCTDDEIIGMGTRTFDAPETAKENTPTNQLRRQARGMRRVIDRRRQRMNDIRDLLHRHGLLDTDGKHALASCADAPWRARAEGLERKLTPHELALALGHMAKHRGFKSNSKRDRGNDPEAGKMLTAVAKTQERLEGRTIGQMFWQDPEFQARKRNRDGDYSRTVLRDDLISETRLLLRAQRRLGSTFASQELEDQFIELAFTQGELRDSWDMVGKCPFEPTEMRAAKHAPSFERFRLLQRLAHLEVGGRRLGADDISAAMKDFGHQQGMTFKRLRKLLNIPPDQHFAGINADEEGKRDVATRTGGAMPGSHALYTALGEAGWQSLNKTPAILDEIAAVLAFRESDDSIRRHLQELGLEPLILTALLDGVTKGIFAKFKGAGHISAKAARAISPHLAQGMTYDKACEQVGYDHARRAEGDIDTIRNPIAKKALLEGMKQVNAVIEAHRRQYGIPTHIHVELAREVGKSQEERQEITAGIEKRNSRKDALRAQFRTDIGRDCANAEELLRFELWKEQNNRCLYSDTYITTEEVCDGSITQVDHILPLSRSSDDSYANKTLCRTKANQDKGSKTPFEWLGGDSATWDRLSLGVNGCLGMKGYKKRVYLLKDASILESRFVNRNLNDTRYACRLLLHALKGRYPSIKEQNIRARPGPLTDRLRRAWGIQGLKKDPNGKRIEDDRHHGLDALIIAYIDQSRLQRLTELFKKAEQEGSPREFAALEPPWDGFRRDAIQAWETITVSRAERRRARGAGHAATIRQVAERDGEKVVYERKSVEALTEKDLDRVKDAERNHRVIESLRTWIKAGKPKGSAPLDHQGQPIRKVRLATNKKVDVEVRDGAADRGEMARVDVFRKANKKGKWEYFLVPVYPHEVATLDAPPNRAVSQKDEWPVMDASHEFIWSLYPLSWVRAVKSDGQVYEGYFRGLDRSTGAIAISPHYTKTEMTRGIGAKTLAEFRKFAIDRLGNLTEIQQEKRTWRGEVCI
ncbi:MAG: type II CRISPR RNA-guided endonuclease Cas9 [Magnetospirillum sp.]